MKGAWLFGLLLLAAGPAGGLRLTPREVGGLFVVPVPEGWLFEAAAPLGPGLEADVRVRAAARATRPDGAAHVVAAALGEAVRGPKEALEVFGMDPADFRLSADSAEWAGADFRVGLVVRSVRDGLRVVVLLAARPEDYERLGGLGLVRRIASDVRPARADRAEAPSGGSGGSVAGRWKTAPGAGMWLVNTAEGGLDLVTYGGVGEGVEVELRPDGRFRWRVAGTAAWMWMEVVYEGRWQARGGDRVVLTLESYDWKPYGQGPQAPPVREVELRVLGRQGDEMVLEGPCGVGSEPFMAIFESSDGRASGVCRIGLRRQT